MRANPRRLVRRAAISGLAVPLGVLVVSYAAIAAYSGTPWLWSVVVHEAGDRTLLGTILYFEHAARELPLDLILGAAVAGGVLFAFPRAALPARARATRLAVFGAATLITSVLIIAGTLRTGGAAMLLENLFQLPTRPGEPLVWGGHWRYHFLSRAALLLLAFGISAPLVMVEGRSGGSRRGWLVFAGAAATFAGLTIVFVPGAASFTDPVYLGHQARELVTHAAVTVPLSWSACLFATSRTWSDEPEDEGGVLPPTVAVLAAVAAVIIGLYLGVSALMTSAASQGQSTSLPVLIFPHFFEHTFTYVVTAVWAAFLYCLGATRTSGRVVSERMATLQG